MSIPDFERAEYSQPQVIEGDVVSVGEPVIRGSSAAFPVALLFGAVAALAGSLGYAVIGFSGFMVSIVAIGVGWLVARAMMTATGGVGGRHYQIASAILTYFAVSLGEWLDMIHYSDLPLSAVFRLPLSLTLEHLIAGPIFALRSPFSGAIGLVILFVGLRAAWQLAAGSPGFGQSGRIRRVDPFGLR